MGRVGGGDTSVMLLCYLLLLIDFPAKLFFSVSATAWVPHGWTQQLLTFKWKRVDNGAVKQLLWKESMISRTGELYQHWQRKTTGQGGFTKLYCRGTLWEGRRRFVCKDKLWRPAEDGIQQQGRDAEGPGEDLAVALLVCFLRRGLVFVLLREDHKLFGSDGSLILFAWDYARPLAKTPTLRWDVLWGQLSHPWACKTAISSHMSWRLQRTYLHVCYTSLHLDTH